MVLSAIKRFLIGRPLKSTEARGTETKQNKSFSNIIV